MSPPVPLAVISLRNLIREAEAKADESLMAKLDLMKQILRVRQTEDMPAPHIAQDGIIRLARAIQANVDSQNDLFRTHDALSVSCRPPNWCKTRTIQRVRIRPRTARAIQ